MNMTKAAVKKSLGLTTDEALAQILGLTRQAVHLWPDNKVLASPYLWVLYGKYPRKFPKPKEGA